MQRRLSAYECREDDCEKTKSRREWQEILCTHCGKDDAAKSCAESAPDEGRGTIQPNRKWNRCCRHQCKEPVVLCDENDRVTARNNEQQYERADQSSARSGQGSQGYCYAAHAYSYSEKRPATVHNQRDNHGTRDASDAKRKHCDRHEIGGGEDFSEVGDGKKARRDDCRSQSNHSQDALVSKNLPSAFEDWRCWKGRKRPKRDNGRDR